MNAADYSPVAGTAIKLVSLTGQLIQYLRNTDETGQILECTVESLKNGGTNSITFSVDRKTNVPVFPGLIIEVYKDGELFATGYSNTVPDPQSDTAQLEVFCYGFMHKLENSTISKEYSSVTLYEIIADLEDDLEDVDLFYDVSKLELPDITISSLTFEDKTPRDVVDAILQIANNDFSNYQYRWFIDTERILNFELIPDTIERGLYEGFNYQDPEVEEDDEDIVNQVMAYRTDEDDSSSVSFVAQYDDTDSQGKYGIRSKKVVFPDYIDTATMANYANAILEENKDTQVKILLENLEGGDFPFRFYKLNNRWDDYWQLLSECDSFDNWDVSKVLDTEVSLSSEQVLTGRQSIKCACNAGSYNEYLQLNPDSPIFGPQLFRMYLFLTESVSLEISLIDTNDIEYTFELGSSVFNLEVNETATLVKNLEIYTPDIGNNGYSIVNFGEANYG